MSKIRECQFYIRLQTVVNISNHESQSFILYAIKKNLKVYSLVLNNFSSANKFPKFIVRKRTGDH